MTDNIRRLKREKKERDVYERFIRNNPNAAITPPQTSYVPSKEEAARERAIDLLLSDTTHNNRPSYLSNFAKDTEAPTYMGDFLTDPDTPKRLAKAYADEQERIRNMDYAQKPVSMLSDKEKKDLKNEYESIENTNAFQRLWNQGVRATADLWNVNLRDDYPDYGSEYERKQELSKNYREIKDSEAYKALLDHGFTDEDIKMLNTQPLSTEEIKDYQNRGFSDEDINEFAEERFSKQQETRKRFEDMMATVDDSWGVTTDDITRMVYERSALPEIERDTEEHPIINSLYTLASNPVESAAESIANVVNYASGNPMQNYKTTTETVRDTVTNNIDSQLGKIAYGGAMSIGDTAVSTALAYATGGGSIVSAGVQALEKAAQVMGEGVDRDLTPDQIFAEGIASGVTTYLTEKIPMGMAEKVVENGLTEYTAREIGNYLGSMFITEGLQEGFEDVADWAMDAAITWDKNEFNTEVQELIAQGMSKKDAVTQVIANRAIEMMTDIVIGGISGAQTGATSSAVAYGTGKYSNTPTIYTNKILSSPKALKQMVDAVNNIDTTNLEDEDLERVEHAQEVAKDIVDRVVNSEAEDIREVVKEEEIVDLANVLNEQADTENRLDKTINEINYQATYDQSREEYKKNKKITPVEGETELEKAARKSAESIAVREDKEEQARKKQREKELLDYQIKGLKSKLGKTLYKVAEEFENEHAVKTFLDNFKDQNAALYSTVSLQAYHAGETGQSFKSFMDNSVEAKVMLNNGVTEAYLKTLYYQGQNTRNENLSTDFKVAMNPNRGKATGGVDELTPLKQKVAEFFGVEVATDFEKAVANGDFNATIAKIIVGANSDNQYQTMMHEVFELARAYNPKGMAIADRMLIDMLVEKNGERSFIEAVNSYKQAYRKAGEDAKKNKNLSEEDRNSLIKEADKTTAEATEEFINDAISYIFSTDEGIKTFTDFIMGDEKTSNEEKVSAIQAIKDFVDHLITSIKNFLKGHPTKQLGYNYAKMANFSSEELESVSRYLTGVLQGAKEELARKTESGSGKTEAKEVAHSIEVTDIEKQAAEYGIEFNGDSDIRFSLAVHKNGGRDFLKEYLQKYSGLSKRDQKDILETLEWGSQIAEEFANDDDFKSFSNWSNTTLQVDDTGKPLLEVYNKDGKPIRSVVVNNGEYPLNIDFSQVCKKRIALNNVLNKLVTDADLNLAVLTESDIAGINRLIKEHQFEIACGLCFVDAKRYRVGAWADTFVNGKVNAKTHEKESMGWNDLVNSMLKKGVSADYFNLASDHTTPLGLLLKDATDDQIDFTTLDEIIKPYLNKKGTLGAAPEEARMAYLLRTDPTSRMFLDKNDIIASEGLDALRAKYTKVYALVNSHGGTAKPKLSHGFTAYGNDILRAESWKRKKNRFYRRDAFAVGGVRVQSFSDYVANLFFDYMQMFADMSARELPSHAYTKEATYARLFGMTGQRINMSIIFKGANLTEEQSKRLEELSKKGRDAIEADPEFKELMEHAGLDENGNYIFEDESFDFEEAKAIQNDPRYKYCGTIGVGLSYEHIKTMLKDDNIKMVIPYHSSGVSQIIKNARNLVLYTDYTDVQNTRDKNGNKLKKEPFDWYAHLKSEINPKGLDAKGVAEEYKKFCKENGYLPKFDQFATDPNYYKLLIDFRAYDNDGKFMPQTAVKMNFPEEAEFKKLVSDSLKAQQETEDRMEKEMSGEQKSLYKEVKDFLKQQGTLTETGDVRYSLAVHAGDLGKSEGFWQMTSSRRGTGHFGTGTYFVGDEEQINKYVYENRPHEKVDFDNYNLFKPKNYKEGMALHEALKFINNSVYDYEVLKDLDNIEKDLAWLDVYGMNLYHETDVDKAVDGLNKLYDKYGKYLSNYEKNRLGDREDYKDETDFLMNFSDYGQEIREGLEDLQERFDKSVSDLANVLEISEDKARQQMLDVLEECSKIEDAYHEARYADSPSTRFMKAFGYEGIDVRDIKQMDNVEYGSVIYDLKGDDLKRKQEIGTARYSLPVTMDSEGRKLSKEQQKYFKDSKIRDAQGNLLKVYHGSMADFTVFDIGEARDSEDIEAFFFSPVSEEAEGYGNTRAFYLNITNPADFDTAYDIFFKHRKENPAGAGARAREELISLGYDGVAAIDSSDPEYPEYLAFYPEQIKLVSNTKPTKNEDIRFSLSVSVDSEGKELSEGQKEFFKDSKIVDENGNLIVMYHGTRSGGFTIFNARYSDDKRSLFFSDNKDVAKSYTREFGEVGDYKEGSKGIMVYPVYLNVTNPLIIDAKGASWARIQNGDTKEYVADRVTIGDYTFLSQEDLDAFDKDTGIKEIYEAYQEAQKEGSATYKGEEYDEDELLDYLEDFNNEYAKYFLNHKKNISAKDFFENPLNYGWWDLYSLQKEYDHNGPGIAEIKEYADYDYLTAVEQYKEHFDEEIAEGNLEEDFYDEFTFGVMPKTGEDVVQRDLHNTRWYARKAQMEGYDGVIFKNLDDSIGTGKESTVVVAFNSNQVKLTSNENPTDDPDIRHSVDVQDDAFFEAFQEVDEKVKLDESDLEQFIKNGDIDSEVTQKAVREVASNIKKQYNSNVKVDSLAADIKSVFRYLKSTGKMSMKDIMFVMKEIARPVLEDVKSTDPEQEKMYKSFINKLKGYKISLDAGQMNEVAHSFGSYYEFVRAMSGKMNLSKNGTPLDNIWTELCDISDGHLSYGTNPNDQPLALAEYIYGLKPTYQTMEGETLDDAATDLALEIFRQFYVYQSMTDAASKVKGELNRRANEYKNTYKKAYNEALKQVEAERNLNIERLAKELDNLTAEEQEALRTGDALNKAMIENLKADYQRRLDRLRAQSNQKIAQEKAKYQNAWITKNLRRERSELKNRVLREVKALQNLIAHPSEGATKHVPINLIKPTIEMLEAINLDNGGRNKAIAERLKKMAEVYESFKGEEYSFDYDERIANDIKELREMFENKSYADLEIMELERVIEIVTALKTQIKNANNLILQGKLKDAQEAASSAMSSVRQSRRYDNAAMNALNKYANVHLNAYREFRKLSGYMGGTLMDIYEDLDTGSKKEMQIQKDLGAIFQSVLEGKENQKEIKKFISTKKEDLVDIGITDKNGKPILITRAMRMSLIMHSMNASNMRHVLGSGITIPNMYYFEKGKMDEAYAKGTNYRFVDYAQLLEAIQKNDTAKIEELTKAAEQRIEDMKKDLSPWEQRFLMAAEEMFHEKTGKYINETSLALKGYAIARVKNYFPIKTDAHFTTQEWAGLVQNGSLEGSGVLKERVVSTKPILLEDITNVIERQIRFTSKYAGLAIAVRNFETIMKQTSRSQVDGQLHNLYETIDSVWGASDTKWLKNLMQDIQGGRGEKNDPLSSFLSRLRGQFAGATLAMNVSVAASQAASYPTAGAVLGFKPLMKAMKDMGNGFVKKQGIEELEDINPLLWYRNQGNATQDLADAKKAKLPPGVQKLTNWIEFMDTGTVRTLEYASMYYVDENFTNLEKGSEEYWQKVSEIFSKVVEETQPNYSVLHRPDILRSPNAIIKLFSMFKTQSLQNFGIVYDALGELNAAYRSGNKQWQKQAATKVGNAVGSQVAAATMFSAIKVLAQLLYHRIWKFRDEDDEWSWAKFAEMFGWQLVSTFAGCFIFGSEVADWLKAKLTKTKYYGVELSTVSMVNDLLGDIRKATDNADKLGASVTEEDREKNFNAMMGNMYNIGVTVGEFVGVPVNNVKNLVSSIFYYGTDIKDAIETGEFNPSNDSDIIKSLTDTDVPNMYERIYEVYDGDQKKYDKLVDELKEKVAKDNPDMTEDEVATKVQEDVTDNILKLLKADYLEGNVSYENMSNYLEEEKGKTEDQAFFQIREWETGESTWGVLRNSISEAAENPTAETRKAVIDEINVLLNHGKDKSDIAKEVTKKFKPEYIELYNQGKAADLNAILRTALVTMGYTDEEAKKKISDWLK